MIKSRIQWNIFDILFPHNLHWILSKAINLQNFDWIALFNIKESKSYKLTKKLLHRRNLCVKYKIIYFILYLRRWKRKYKNRKIRKTHWICELLLLQLTQLIDIRYKIIHNILYEYEVELTAWTRYSCEVICYGYFQLW